MSVITGHWIAAPGTQAVFDLLEGAGFQAWFVGGCVRNALLGEAVDDIDISTDATPDEVMKLCECSVLRAVPTGVEHGTVTVVSGGTGFEVTTFRRDVETDGRRAVVAFSTDMLDDARRRDFTINALYADRRGRVSDPLGQGLADLAARQVRFIEDAGRRIREDYLRILRFFRFHAHYGHAEAGLDPEALDAIVVNSAGLETLSRERVGAEMKKLLAADDPTGALAAMAHTGVLARILPGSDPGAIGPLVALEQRTATPAHAIRRLAALGGEAAAERLRLSKSEARRLDVITNAATGNARPAELGYKHGADAAWDAVLVRAAFLQDPPGEADRTEVARGAAAVFPVTAADLMPGLGGPALGRRLAELEARWIASDFTLDRAALLEG